MSLINGVWHDAKLDPPGTGHVNQTVLIVKQLKNGSKVITFGSYISCIYKPISGKWEGNWTTNNGKGNVLYWAPLPEIPD